MNPYYDTTLSDIRKDFLRTDSPKFIFVVNALLATIYFLLLAFYFPVGNRLLFTILIAGEVFHMWQVFTFLYTVWDTSYEAVKYTDYVPGVDIFITVAGEPVELVHKTVQAAKVLRYPNTSIYILNDGYVAGKDNWRDMETLAEHLGVKCITRTVPGGAKAGNINNALRFSSNPLIACFDADHVPHSDFLLKTVPYFGDPLMGFVQTPQFYKNYGSNYLTSGSWEQQELFYGAICKGKNRLNATTMCGTNMVIRRSGLEEVGGMCTESIAEDFITGLLMHNRGYRSMYVPEVLAEGLATEDLLSYSKQQFRWARGALDVIFRWNPIFMHGLTLVQKVQYLSSASFYLSGVVIVVDALLPVIFLYSGMIPLHISGMLLAAAFLPYFFVTLYSIQRSSNFTFSFSSIGFSMGSFHIHLRALASAATFRKASFGITEKYGLKGNFLPLVKWHIVYIAVVVAGVPVALLREGVSASLLNNGAWALLNSIIFFPFIRAALPTDDNAVPDARTLPVPQTTYETALNN